MADEIQVFQKPTCTKCRAAVDLLHERGIEFCSIDYYQAPFTPDSDSDSDSDWSHVFGGVRPPPAS